MQPLGVFYASFNRTLSYVCAMVKFEFRFLVALVGLLIFAVPQAYAQQNKDIFTPNGQTPMYQNNVLIELFSSEGCSSCPFADAFMQEVIHLSDSSQTPVYVIDYHVDYWNKSGWVDPYSDSMYSKRQLAYCKVHNEPSYYTPMALVNGGKPKAGSDKKRIGVDITQNLARPTPNFMRLKISAIPGEDSLIVGYKAWGPLDSLDFHAVLVQKSIQSEITSGENKDRVLHHSNVVRRMASLSVSKDDDYLKIYVHPTINLDNYRLIGFLQHRGSMRVVAVDQLVFKP